MRRLTFEEMAFSRASDAWCPVTGRSVGPNTPRVVSDKILKCLGDIPVYHKFLNSQGFVRYSNDPGCFDRPLDRTHVFTDEMNALETRVAAALPTFVRGTYWTGSEESRPLEYLISKPITASDEVLLVTTLIHGNESDGILGTLKAFEVMCTNPDFASLRDQYVIAMLPCCNPDGYFKGLRNLSKYGPHPSGTPVTINLNRVWPWFWTEFVPSADESKGDAPITCSEESQGMEAFIKQLPGGDSIKLAWVLDQHATAGDGARYVSRDRNFRDLSEDDYEKMWADWNTYRILKSVQARRVQEDAMPDLWINFFRSCWRPHWHSYLGTRSLDNSGGIQTVSLLGEHNKVYGQVTSTVRETYASASNFNFDHIIAMALVAQGGITERKAAVLVEHEVGNNLVTNSQFEAWQSSEYRPSYWSGTRILLEESARSEQHMLGPGRPVAMSADVITEMTTGYTDDFGGSDCVMRNGSSSVMYLVARVLDGVNPDRLSVYSWDLQSDPVQLFYDYTASTASHQWKFGKCVAASISMVGLGNIDTPVDAVFVSYDESGGVWTPTTRATHSDPLVGAAVVYDRSNKAYVFGGRLSAGSSSAKVYKADSSAWTFTEVGSDLLVSGDYGMGGDWCIGGSLDNRAVLVGGTDAGGSGLVVRVFNPVTPAITSYTVTVPSGCSPSLAYSGVWYDGVDSVYVYGGSAIATGNVYSEIMKLTWTGSGFTASLVELIAGLSDDGDPEDYAGDEVWNRPFRYWRAVGVADPDSLENYVVLFGGLERLPDGSEDTDLDNRRGFWCHYYNDDIMSRPADYDFGYLKFNVHLDVTGYSKAVSSWSYKSAPVLSSDASTAYVRINNASGDSGAGLVSVRKCRTYYLHPPQSTWWREHAAINFSMAKPSKTEDEWRQYLRTYRQAQKLLVDAPMVQTGTLWPSSWSPYGLSRAVEEASWSNVADNRWYRIGFDFLPAASFMNLSGNSQKLLTIGDITGSQYTEIYLKGDDYNREYGRGNSVGAVEPYIQLKVTDGISTPVTLNLPMFWGGYVKDTAMGRFESPIHIEVWRHSQYGTGMIVKNGWAKGWVKDSTRFSPGSWGSDCDIKIHGGGWWTEPEIMDFDKEWKTVFAVTENENGALLVGDRDPCYGQISAINCFDYTETFTRTDGTNLGDYWDIISQTGSGWDINSNKARCAELGIEKWDAYPYIRDCAVIAEVSAPSGGKVGLCTRLHWGLGVDGFTHGYVGYLECTGATTGNLIIKRYYWNSGSQSSSVLSTQAVTYAAGTTVTLTLEAIDDDITLTMSGSSTGTVTVADSNHLMPGAFGIYGETPGAGQYVYIDSVSAEVRNNIKIRITE